MENFSIELLEQLAQAIQAISPIVWEASIKAAVVEGWMNLFISILLAVMAVVCFRSLCRFQTLHEKENDEFWYKDSDMVLVTLLMSLLIFVFAIVSLMLLSTGLTGVLVPEWNAIQNLLELLQQ